MHFDRVSRRQKVVLWPAVGNDPNGEVTVSAAVELKNVRFENGRKETINAEAEPISYDASLYAEQDVAINSIVWQGKLADVPEAPSPLYQVIGVDISPGPQAKTTNKAYQLQRWKGNLPAIV